MQTRNTKQKKIVLDAVRKLANHPTAEQVFMHVQNLDDKVAKGTVYRNLNLLAETGEVKKIEMPNAPTIFDHQLRSHYHLKCNNCGKIFDSKNELSETFISDFNQDGFDVEGFNLVLNGICAECKNKKRRK